MTTEQARSPLFQPLHLPCGATLKNRLVKAAMSDVLADGCGQPTPLQCKLYARWARGGVAVSIIGEVQGSPDHAENPGNLVLQDGAEAQFRRLARAGRTNNAGLWLQLGHAGALAPPSTSDPAGPSALDLPGLRCREMPLEEVRRLPEGFAHSALTAKKLGFGGVEIHAAHGFLLSQFLSPLFNRRSDVYGGSEPARQRIVLEVVSAVRDAVGSDFPVAIKLNATDNLEGGLREAEALALIDALDVLDIDLIDISGGTYFPGAASSSDGGGKGPYFAAFAKDARARTERPLMLTGGFKSFAQAHAIVSDGHADVIGLARALVLEPDLPALWRRGQCFAPAFPALQADAAGAVTAWYTQRIKAIAKGSLAGFDMTAADALDATLRRDDRNTGLWNRHFRDLRKAP